MVAIVSHLKIQVVKELRNAAMPIYVDVLSCQRIASRSASVDMLRLPDGYVIRLFAIPSSESL